jgi:hypothetical protein
MAQRVRRRLSARGPMCNSRRNHSPLHCWVSAAVALREESLQGASEEAIPDARRYIDVSSAAAGRRRVERDRSPRHLPRPRAIQRRNRCTTL